MTENKQTSVSMMTDILSNVSVTCPPITLVVPNLQQTLSLAQHLYDGLWDDPTQSTLGRGWYTDDPSDRARYAVSYFMDAWTLHGQYSNQLPFAVIADGVIVGVQALNEVGVFSKTKELETWSWLAKQYRGKGYSIPMRYAAIHVGFEVLGAEVLRSAALNTNTVSMHVSEKCGYSWDGTETKTSNGYVDHFTRYRLDKQTWNNSDLPKIVCDGKQDLQNWVQYRQQHSLKNPFESQK